MEHKSDKLDALLYAMNVKLSPYQRKFVEKCMESDGKIYITMPHQLGRIQAMKHIAEIMKVLEKKEKEMSEQ